MKQSARHTTCGKNMNRRKFFANLLGASALALPSVSFPESKHKEEDLYTEFTCLNEYEYSLVSLPPCKTRFKVLKGVMPICPICNYAFIAANEHYRGIKVS